MKKRERGAYDFYVDSKTTSFLEVGIIIAFVTVATNFDYVEPLASSQHYNKDQIKTCLVLIPRLIKNYSSSMGGVALND